VITIGKSVLVQPVVSHGLSFTLRQKVDG
jgi:hypothetical protein